MKLLFMATNNPTGTSNKEMIRKIIIGTVSTVLAALIIYYIVERGGGDRQRKKATLNAWNSYQQNKGIFREVMTTLGKSMQQGIGTLEQGKATMTRDVDMSISNMENIKLESNVDNRMLSLVDIKVSQLKEMKSVMLEMIGKLETLMQADITDQQAEQYALSVLEEAKSRLETISDRDKIRISSFRKELCEEYGDDFCTE